VPFGFALLRKNCRKPLLASSLRARRNTPCPSVLHCCAKSRATVAETICFKNLKIIIMCMVTSQSVFYSGLRYTLASTRLPNQIFRRANRPQAGRYEAHSKISFRLIAKISQAKLANSRGVNWHSPAREAGGTLPLRDRSSCSRWTNRQIVEHTRQKMDVDPNFFNRLPRLSPERPVLAREKLDSLRVYEDPELGMDVVVKCCGEWHAGAFQHGFFESDPEQSGYIRFFRAYRTAVTMGTIAENITRLVALEAYGSFCANGIYYIIMEHLNLPDFPKGLDKRRNLAAAEIDRNVERVRAISGIMPPQWYEHLLWIRYIVSERHNNGRFVVALPHDRI